MDYNKAPDDNSNAQESSSENMAYKHSFGLFDGISNEMWEKMRQHTLQTSWYANPQNPLENIENSEEWTAKNMNANFDCPNLEPLGANDGGKTMCNPQRLVHEDKSNCLMYSVGSAGNFKFEDALSSMHDTKCEIHVFDPANWERPGDVENKNIHYHAWGMTSTYDNSKSVVWPKGRGGGFKTFPDTIQELGHQNRTMDLLKIDCEGCEWSTLKDWIAYDFKQVLIEVHGVPTPSGKKFRYYQKPMNLAEYYQNFIDHGYALYEKKVIDPIVLELSFIKLHPDFWKRD